MTATGKYLASLYPLPNYNDPNNLYNYVYSRSSRRTAPTSSRGSTGTSATAPRPTSASRAKAEATENPRGVWWGPSDVALPTPNIGDQHRPVVRRQRRVGAEPVDDQRGAGQLQPARRSTTTSRIPSLITQGAGGITFNGIFPAGTTSPYLPTDLLHGWGGSGQVGNLWAAANDVYAHNDSLQFSDKLTKLLGHARHEVRRHARARPEAAELPEPRGRPALVRHRQQHRHRQSAADMLVGPHRPVQPGHGGQRQPVARRAVRRVPLLEHRRVRAGQLEAAART